MNSIHFTTDSPLSLLFSDAILFLSPYITLFGSILLFGTIAYFIAKKPIKIQTANALFHLAPPELVPAQEVQIEAKDPQNLFPQQKYALAIACFSYITHNRLAEVYNN